MKVLALLAVLASLSAGCAVQAEFHIQRAARCEVRAVPFYYADGTVGSMAFNVCRFGAVGRTPELSETRDPYKEQ